MAKRQQKTKPKRPKGNFLVRLIVLFLLAGLGWQLYFLHKQVQDAEATRQETAEKVAIKQQENSALKEDISEGPTTKKMKELAEDKLGLVEPGTYQFHVFGLD